MARSLEKPADPTFQTLKALPVKHPLAEAIDTFRPLNFCHRAQLPTRLLYSRSKCLLPHNVKLCRLTNQTDSESYQDNVMETGPTQALESLQADGELSDHDKDSVVADQDLMLSEEQPYRETETLDHTCA